MNKDNDIFDGCALGFVKLALFILFILFLMSCKTTRIATQEKDSTYVSHIDSFSDKSASRDTIEKYIVKHDSIYKVSLVRDTTVLRDSVFVKESEGNRVEEKWHWVFRYTTKYDTIYKENASDYYERQYHELMDSVSKMKSDTTYINNDRLVTRTEEVERKFTWFERLRLFLGWLMLLLIVLAIGYAIYKNRKTILKLVKFI